MHRAHRPLVVLVAALALGAAACGSEAPSTGASDGGEVPPALESATRNAVSDLAASEDVDAEAIEVVTAEQVTWPDGALGCPEPDGMYTQALVPGYRIVLALDGAEFAYHAAEGGEPARCDDPQPPVDADG